MADVALVILFNHNYESNIERLEKIYSGRFDNIFFIVPFYKGEKSNVISVYENSLYFQGYISKALEKIKDESFSHYIIIGDDLILNPDIDQNNYNKVFKLKDHTGFMPGLFLLTDSSQTSPDRPLAPYWPGIIDALKFRVEQKGIEVKKFLPSRDEAVKILEKHGFTFSFKMSWKFLLAPLKKLPVSGSDYELKKRVSKHYFSNFLQFFLNRKLHYPLIGSYSDICIVPKSALSDMIAYCGVFAALNLFAEIALPTAFALCVKDITTEADLNSTGITLWNPSSVSKFENQYKLELDLLFREFPEHTLYVHPIKLSRWKVICINPA